MIGDGSFISQGSKKRKQLFFYTNMHVSTDGYYASKLESGLQKSTNLNFDEMVIIGHPKGNTIFSLKKLTEFVDRHYTQHSFISFKSIE